jgi:release factor glutamine methyltransferase
MNDLKQSASIAETISQGAQQLRNAGVPEARREAGSFLAYVLDRDRSYLLTHAEDAIREEQAERFLACLNRRTRGEPLQYITANQEFYGLNFEVSKDVLIPRPETELLVETALKLFGGTADISICDVGTGSGCIAVTLLQHLPEARAVAIDFSAAALIVAQRNATRHSVNERVEFICSNCFAALNPPPSGRAAFDLIVSNPPYIEEGAMADLQREVRDFEPHEALVAGPDGLVIIRRLLIEAANFLKPGGYFLFEIGFNQANAVRQLVDPQIWRLVDIYNDLQGIPRTVALQRG